MSFPGEVYAPPGVYTRTIFENPVASALEALKIPVFIGEGSENLVQNNLEVIRGSSSTNDQKVVQEDETGRAVVSVSGTGVVTLGQFDGVRTKFQVRNFPVVTGDGTGTTSTNRSDAAATINGQPIVVLRIDGAKGIIELAQPPKVGDLVRCTYFFDRTDTLITEDLSSQVDPDPAVVQAIAGVADANAAAPASPPVVLDFHGDILNGLGEVIIPANNVLDLTVDAVDYSLVIPPRTNYTLAQVATALSSLGAGSLVGSTFINNYGLSTLQLSADHSVVVNGGSANALLGLQSGQSDPRVRTFYTFQGPIVNGSGGGVTTTDPSTVTVKVDGVQTIPTAVDGANRAITLAVAPKAGAVIQVTYWFNTWQDTFDYLANINITSIIRAAEIPDSSSYVEGADFILKDDKMVWGTAVLVSSGLHTASKEFFNESQIGATLVDNKIFLGSCSTISGDTTGTKFQLPAEPTTGNGRDTPLGQSLYQTVSNSRIDLPTNRPDLVSVYWGYSLQDALLRGKVSVVKVDGVVVTLKDRVPVGANVYASFYYNILTDQQYTLATVVPGVSGTGTYTIQNAAGVSVYNPSFDPASKGPSLAGVTVEFPSGSELKTDLHHEPQSGTSYKGPVQEIVTLQFANRFATPAQYTVPGAGPYEFIAGESSKAQVVLDGGGMSYGTAGLSLVNPTGAVVGAGFFASLVSNEINYTGGFPAVVGQGYLVSSPEYVNLVVDGASVAAVVPDSAVSQNIGYYATWINEAAAGHQGAAGAGTLLGAVELAATASSITNYYVGWTIVVGAPSLAAGLTQTVTAYNGITKSATVSDPTWGGGPVPAAADLYYTYNPAARSTLKASTRFDNAVTLAAGGHDQLRFHIQDGTNTLAATVTLAVGTYATAAALAVQVQTQITAAITAALGGTPALAGWAVECTADADGRLQFQIQLPGTESTGFLTFLSLAPAVDFAVLAGISTGSAVARGQAVLNQGPIAETYSVVPSGSFRPYDRLMLRNRVLPGGGGSMSYHTFQAQMGLEVQAGSGNDKAGLEAGMTGEGAYQAVVQPASIAGYMSLTNGLDAVTGEPLYKFYSGTGLQGANNIFEFEIDGVAVSVEFTDILAAPVSGSGTDVPLGPGTTANTVLWQISNALWVIPGNPFGLSSATDAITQGIVRQEGAGIRLTGVLETVNSYVRINSGSANAVLGFSTGAVVQRSMVTTKVTASAFMNQAPTTYAQYLRTAAWAPVANSFAAYGLAGVAFDTTGNGYLYLQDAPSLAAGLGAASSIVWDATNVAGTQVDDVLFPSTGLGVQAGAGDTGEEALNGFFVKSNAPDGTGSKNDSMLNNGIGSDGYIGQTYHDAVTGLTFTILPRGFLNNPYGPWLAYPVGSNATLRFNVSSTFLTDANKPHNAVPGVELLVSNTYNVGVGDTAIVETFERGGTEPAIGDSYYVSYVYQKEDFSTAFFTKMSTIEQVYGAVLPDNPVSLAAYLAILNGAVVVGIKQVQKVPGSSQASLDSYVTAISELEGVQPGNVQPDIIVPLRGDSTDLYQVLKRSNNIMSSIRYRSERTSIIGMSAGSLPKDAQTLATTLADKRMRLVYPDIATVSLQDALGATKEYLIDGPMLAAGLTGSVVSSNTDVATPWTGRRLVGYTQLARKLDIVEQNQVAQSGVTILEEKPPFFRVRHGLTTDMTNVLTKLPTIVMIADEVQKQTRNVLDNFIGIKFLPGILSQIEGRLAMMLKSLVFKQIISAYTGIKAEVSPEDPTTAICEAWYSPVFPLLFIIVTYNLRSKL